MNLQLEKSIVTKLKTGCFSCVVVFTVTVKHTEQLFSQHAQLVLVEALTGEGGELPAEHLGELVPRGPRWVTEERQVLGR